VEEQQLERHGVGVEGGALEVMETGPFAPVKEPSLLHTIFLGPDGLRPGWGLVLFVVLFVALVQGAFFAAVHLHLLPAPSRAQGAPTKPMGPGMMLTIEALMGGSALAASWGMAKIERRRLGEFGFGGTGKARLFVAGFAWGAAFLALLVGGLWKAGLLAFDGRLLFGMDVLKYGAVWLVGFILVAVFEESLLRGYVQFTLGRGLASLYRMAFREAPSTRARAVGFWAAAVGLSFLFGAGHGSNPGESPIGLVSAGLIGLVFCLTLWRTGSLWWALGFHAAWDWAQSFVFGVADSGMMVRFHLMGTHPLGKVLLSGGATGPEGSALILGEMVLVVRLVLWTVPKGSVVSGEILPFHPER
jgi:uncharacterized protein